MRSLLGIWLGGAGGVRTSSEVEAVYCTPQLGNVALTQAHVLAVGDITSTPDTDNATLSQEGVLTVQDITAAPSLDNIALAQTYTLTVQNITCQSTLTGGILRVFNPSLAAYSNQIVYGGEARRCSRRT